MKKQNKVISILFAILVLLSIVIPANIIATETTSVSINESYISAVTIKDTITGLAPFDNDDNAGNDSSASNDIVRSFDDIDYTLEYVTALKSQNVISDAYLCVEFVLPYTKDVATFNMDAMAWMENPVLVEENGKQILTGRRFLQNTSDNNAIPGAGTLSVGIKVKAAPNGTKIDPEFKLYMDGNTADEAKTAKSQEITVSAAPKYDIEIKKATRIDDLKYFDTTTGNYSEEPIENGKRGRVEGYGIALRLYNESISKGLKGIELPTGTIEFDLILEEGLTLENSGNLTTQENYTPFVWDYKPNNLDSNTGDLGRNMRWKWGRYSVAAWATVPASNGGKADSCYNSGNWTITQTNTNSLHIEINDYKFSPNYEFPIRYIDDSTDKIRNGDNIGYFSTYYFQAVCQFPEEIQNVTNIYLTAKVENFKATSVTGQSNTDVYLNNNKSTTAINLYPKGNLTKNIAFKDINTNVSLMPNWSEHGDSSLFRNQRFRTHLEVINTSDYTIKSYDLLTKFDDEGFEFPSKEEMFLQVSPYYGTDGETTTLRQLFAAKPDKTGWTDYDEMIAATQEDLIYFEDLDELKAQGYVCVAVLHEGRGCNYPQGVMVQFVLKTKNSTIPGQTYALVNNLRLWETSSEDFSMLDHSYNDGYTLNENGYVEGYPSPTKILDTPYYIKTEYENGVIVPGTHAGGIVYGNTILIKGYDAIISKKISDIDISGNPKTAYDMDANERTVNYELQPEAKAPINGKTTNLYITDTLPKDLSYNIGSSFWGNQYYEPEVIKNEDGTTTLKWTLEDVPIGETLPKIKFSCTIGNAGTNQDVTNNQNIKNIVTIYGDEDVKEFKLISENMAEVSFQVVKLNAISISKSTSTPFVSVGEDFQYTLKFANNSKNEIKNSKLYDVLPYDEDTRNSDFSGFYKINNIILNFANAPKTFNDYTNGAYALNYTNNLDIQTDNFINIFSFNDWNEGSTQTIDSTNKTVTYTELPEDITALLFNMSLQGFEYIEITLNMSPTGNQQEGDVYINDFYQYANGQAEQVHSNQAVVQVYGTLNITKIWNDQDNLYETRPESINISILQNGNIYRILTFDANDVVAGNSNKWNEIAREIPLNDNDGNPYVYTIMEDEENTNLQYYYYQPIYNQDTLTVTNTGVWLELDAESTEPVFHKITVTKNIVNTSGTALTSDDFEKLKLDSTATYYFPITLKQMNRSISKGDTGMIESYQGYTGNVFNGIVTNENALIFINIESGKYEISEGFVQYFDFVDFTKINSSDEITLSEENGKYYITISGFTDTNEYIEVSVTNRIKEERLFEDKNDKENLFLINKINNGMMDPDDPQGH